MNGINVCSNCGERYDSEDTEDEFCALCNPEDTRATLDAPVFAMRNISDLDAE